MSLFSRFSMLMILIGISSCGSNREIDGNMIRIDFSKADNRNYLNSSEYISEIEYVALETSSNCLIGESVSIFISENFILTYSNSNFFFIYSKGRIY